MKFWVILFGLVLTTGAFATDDATDDVVEEGVVEEEAEASVVERVSCEDIKAQITELSAIEEPDEETLEELANLKATQRSKCMRSAGKRRATVGRKALIAASEASTTTEEVLVDENVEKEQPKQETVKEEVVKDVVVEEQTVSELTPEQVQANLDAGLCADGAKPNRFGCCADEIFKDMGNAVFACCPKSGGDCLPPIGK